MLRPDPLSGVPIARQLQDQVRFLVAAGVLAPGQEVPSTRALAAELCLNPMTVSKAYAALVREGLLVRRPGKALVVRQRPARELAATRRSELEAELRSAAFAADKLGFTPAEALEVFRALLERAPSHSGTR
jgi:GntR family transcriptional regulator